MKKTNDTLTAQYWARDIKRLSIQYNGYPIDIFTKTREREVVYYRALHFYLLKNYLRWTYKKILDFYDKNGTELKTHASIINALKKFDDVYSKYDKNLMKIVFEITKGYILANKEKHLVITMLDFLDDHYYKELIEIIKPMYNDSVEDKEMQIQNTIEL